MSNLADNMIAQELMDMISDTINEEELYKQYRILECVIKACTLWQDEIHPILEEEED